MDRTSWDWAPQALPTPASQSLTSRRWVQGWEESWGRQDGKGLGASPISLIHLLAPLPRQSLFQHVMLQQQWPWPTSFCSLSAAPPLQALPMGDPFSLWCQFKCPPPQGGLL